MHLTACAQKTYARISETLEHQKQNPDKKKLIMSGLQHLCMYFGANEKK